jgi:hypothetical protein
MSSLTFKDDEGRMGKREWRDRSYIPVGRSLCGDETISNKKAPLRGLMLAVCRLHSSNKKPQITIDSKQLTLNDAKARRSELSPMICLDCAI